MTEFRHVLADMIANAELEAKSDNTRARHVGELRNLRRVIEGCDTIDDIIERLAQHIDWLDRENDQLLDQLRRALVADQEPTQ